MSVMTIRGKAIEVPIGVSVEDYDGILKRFDLRGAQFYSSRDRFEIHVACPLCLRFGYRRYFPCGKCPFACLRGSPDFGCIVFLTGVVGRCPPSLSLGYCQLSWYRKDDDVVRPWIRKARKAAKGYLVVRGEKEEEGDCKE